MTLGERLRVLALPRRLGYGLAAVVVVFSLLFAVFATATLRSTREQEYVTGTVFDAVTSGALRFRSIVDQETGVRGYALGQQTVLLKPYRDGIRSERQATAELDRLVGDVPALARASAEVEAQAARWRREYAEPLIALVAAGRAGSIDTANLLRGKRLFDEVRTAVNGFRTALLAERDAAVQRQDAASTVVLATLGVALAIGVAAAVAVVLALRRWVTGPVARLGEETRSVRTGTLDHRVVVRGPPEFEALARDVDLMRLGLVEQIAAVERAREEIDAARVELEAKAQELERSNRDLEQFAYVASHDLQEPLRKVASFCQMLERRYSGQLDERADQYIAFAVDGAKRMQALINDLLAFSRVGRLSAGTTEVELEACLQQALRNLDTAITETGARITHDPLPVITGEAPLLVLLLQNLIGNAVKFRGDSPPTVHIGAHREGDEWQLSCSDDGIGIEPRYAERIFVIFQRLHAREDYDGTGIGLAMCKKIVEHHGGRIWLDTSVRKGTTFRWTLPVTVATEAGRPALVSAGPAGSR